VEKSPENFTNADEGLDRVEADLQAAPTVANYKNLVKNEFLNDADVDEVLRLYPAATDADVPNAFSALDPDYEFVFTTYHLAQVSSRSGQKTWFYYFTYKDKAHEDWGAYHGIDLNFLTGWFRSKRWGKPDAEDEKLVQTMTGYWTRFAKTGYPNGPGLPPWPVYDPKSDLVLEIGHEVKPRPTPHTDRFAVFERNLNSQLASIPRPGTSHATPQK